MKNLPKSFLDTRFDTKAIFVSTKHRYILRDYIDKDGKSLLYLVFTDSKKKIRYCTDIKIEKKYWEPKKQRIKIPKDNHLTKIFSDYNVILDDFEAKLIKIKTVYHLTERFLDAETLLNEFQSNTPEFDFISFYKHHLKLQNYKPQTLKNHNSVVKKLEAFAPTIPFHKINLEFFQRYKRHYSAKNSELTYNTDLKCIKKFLNLAEEQGIQMDINLKRLKVSVDSNKIVYLLPSEVQQLLKYYFNEFIDPSHIIPLGYFLFSCYTGLRISDVKNRTREEILQEIFQFSSTKTATFQSMKLNEDARKMILFREELFTKSLVEQKVNFHLKNIAKRCKIDKSISMHIGRHTFATTFYRNTKDIVGLQKLLGHANIRHTLKYVHLVKGEELDGLDHVTY